MPTDRLLVQFESVSVLDDSDFWGVGEWKFNARVDGQQVGDQNELFEAREGREIDLGDEWSLLLDVSEKGEGDTVVITFAVTEDDVIYDDDLGSIRITLQWPFRQDFERTLRGSEVSGTRYFDLRLSVTDVPQDIADMEYEPAIVVSRGRSGSGTYTAFSMNHMTPRIEICPVSPVPEIMPPRPPFPTDFPRGRTLDSSEAVVLTVNHDLNALVNPAFIPSLRANDPDIRTKAARIAVTYIEPHNISRRWFFWHIASGPVEFVDSDDDNLGETEVLVRGTTSEGDADEMAVIELRWSAADGPLLATFRAWVGNVKNVYYRINIINGVDPEGHPERSPNMTHAEVHRYAQIARRFLWQAGLNFQPDPDATCWDGAVATGSPAVYTVPAESDTWTNNVAMDPSPIASRLNFNPDVINITIVRSHVENRAYASDIRGVTGAEERLGGSPSTSWVRPSGIDPDAAATEVVMQTFANRPRNNPSDADYVTARQAVHPGFAEADMQRLHACMYPSIWAQGMANGAAKDLRRAQNLVHELGHVLGLYHRGNGATSLAPLSRDGVNTTDDEGTQRGHPWRENIMCYGRLRALDIDLIQVPVIRRHSSVRD